MTAHRVLLVGGQAEFIERKVVPRLQSLVAPDGAPVRVPRHVAWKTDRFPTDYVRADAIMVVTDMVSHTLSDAARDRLRVKRTAAVKRVDALEKSSSAA